MVVKRFLVQIWWCGGFRLLFLWRLEEEIKIVMVCGGDEDSEGESICDFAGKNGDDGGHDFLWSMGVPGGSQESSMVRKKEDSGEGNEAGVAAYGFWICGGWRRMR
uniref:Uncharacterized protein n=1 Tax=Solanum tuberosum TaxID=4113 RepID=M1C825_SOLTU